MEDPNASQGNLGNEGGNSGVATLPTFAEQLEGSLKTDVRLAQWKDTGISGLVSDHFKLGEELQSFKGKLEGAVRVPGENATQEEVLAFRKAVGALEKPEDYKLERPQLPENVQYNEALEKTFRSTAATIGLSQQQAEGLFKMFNDYELGLYTEVNKFITENKEKSVNALKDIWKGDDFARKTEETKRAFQETLKTINIPQSLGGTEAVIKEFDESGFGDHPAMIYFFNNLYQKISDDKFVSGGVGSGPTREPGMLDFSKSKMPDG